MDFLRATTLFFGLLSTGSAFSAQCLYVSSYHTGYEWNDGIERGIESIIDNRCELDKFYLDSKRNKDPDFIKSMAQKAMQHIEQTKPDVVIACDDNASKYLVVPYLKDSQTPVVFCGINWTVKSYGYPFSNVTGIVEISPIKQLIEQVTNTVDNPKHGIYLAPDVISQRKELELNKGLYAKQGIQVRPHFVQNMTEWVQAYKQANNEADFIIIGNNGGINDWDANLARETTNQFSRVFTVTNYEWMAPFAMLAMTKIAEEQGEWSAQSAMAILDGLAASQIPIVVNRRWNIYVNQQILQKSGVQLAPHIINKAVKVK